MLLIHTLFPNLSLAEHSLTSEPTAGYNCVAWAAGRDDEWWEPVEGYYWPSGIPRDDRLQTLVALYEDMGYRQCSDSTVEIGQEKIALYGDSVTFLHAARQMNNGKWTSKLGKLEDIEHDTLECLQGDEYGYVVVIMKRLASAPPGVGAE